MACVARINAAARRKTLLRKEKREKIHFVGNLRLAVKQNQEIRSSLQLPFKSLQDREICIYFTLCINLTEKSKKTKSRPFYGHFIDVGSAYFLQKMNTRTFPC
jgi:hypothetical protein